MQRWDDATIELMHAAKVGEIFEASESGIAASEIHTDYPHIDDPEHIDAVE